MQIQRIWLHNIGIFEVIPNSGKGSCLFQAISQALTQTTKLHYQIRLSIVKHMTSSVWSRRLHELPKFWKYKIITDWLQLEELRHRYRRRRAWRRKRSGKRSDYNFNSSGNIPCYRCLERLVEKRRKERYLKTKALLQRRTYTKYSHIDDFKFVFREFMSDREEPGTRFELEAAAGHFGFHFDFLQFTPNAHPSSSIKFQLTPTGIISNEVIECETSNNNNESEGRQRKLRFKESSNNAEENKGKLITLNPAIYQFYSCRNTQCKRSQTENRRHSPSDDHFYFLHSPILHSESNDGGCDGGHWELLLPIRILRKPVPLNRRLFGFSYEIIDSDRDFISTSSGARQEIFDTVAKAINAYILENPSIIPLEDPLWPADEEDDYLGCAAALRDCSQKNATSISSHVDKSEERTPAGNSYLLTDKITEDGNLTNLGSSSHKEEATPPQSFSELDPDFSLNDLIKRWKMYMRVVTKRKRN